MKTKQKHLTPCVTHLLCSTIPADLDKALLELKLVFDSLVEIDDVLQHFMTDLKLDPDLALADVYAMWQQLVLARYRAGKIRSSLNDLFDHIDPELL